MIKLQMYTQRAGVNVHLSAVETFTQCNGNFYPFFWKLLPNVVPGWLEKALKSNRQCVDIISLFLNKIKYDTRFLIADILGIHTYFS
jgi:hypothetical protein